MSQSEKRLFRKGLYKEYSRLSNGQIERDFFYLYNSLIFFKTISLLL